MRRCNRKALWGLCGQIFIHAISRGRGGGTSSETPASGSAWLCALLVGLVSAQALPLAPAASGGSSVWVSAVPRQQLFFLGWRDLCPSLAENPHHGVLDNHDRAGPSSRQAMPPCLGTSNPCCDVLHRCESCAGLANAPRPGRNAFLCLVLIHTALAARRDLRSSGLFLARSWTVGRHGG